MRRPSRPRPFVLLHGWACPTSYWAPLAGLLRAAGHEVLAPPLPGYSTGEAPDGGGREGAWPDAAPWDLEAAADAVAERLVRAGPPALVVGHSLGGSVAATLAARRPELVAALGLVGMVPVAPSAAARARLTSLFLEPGAGGSGPEDDLGDDEGDGPAQADDEGDGPAQAAVDVVLRGWYGDGVLDEDLDPAFRRELEAAFRVPGPVLRGSLRAALDGVAREVPDRITAPTAVVLGAGDRTRPPEEVEAFLAAHPSWRLTSVPGAGHMVHWEAPEACAAALLALADAAG